MFTKEDAAILDKVLETRWTCRFFTDEVPSKEDVEEIIQAGIISPYASVASKEVVPFRHFYVFFKGDPRLPVIGEILKKQTAIDIENLKEEQKIELHRAMRRLKPEYAQVLYLMYFEDFDTAEIARNKKKTKRQIGDLLYRAKKTLKSELEKEGFVYEEY